MATVNFLYRSTKDKANLQLRLLYSFNGYNFVFGANTKFQTTKDYWSKEHKQRKFKKTSDVIESNKIQDLKAKQNEVDAELNKIENHVLNAFNSVNPDTISKEWLQTQIDHYYNPPQEEEPLPKGLLKYFDYFIECKKNEITVGTLKKYNVSKHLLERYESDKKTVIQIIDVNEKFKLDFEKYCLKHNYAPNTISKDLRTLKTVCNHAKHNGITTSHQLDTIKTPNYKTEKIYLTFDELQKIEEIDKRRLNDNYDNAKDWLIISCYTGQRISDFMRFKKEMIRYEKNKQGVLKPYIEFTQVKTDKIMTVALHPKVIEILDKRNGNFPKVISDPKYNLFIKQVCRIAEIDQKIKGSKLNDLNKDVEEKKSKKDDVKQYRKESGMFPKWELITSHIGRRSFATNFYGTIPTTYLMNVTGHSTEAMFLNYLGKSNKDLAIEIANYF
ncbi:site-specific integrase [Flavobacterium sp. F-380]|uniref:Site-specific integrase n=1 Tax=Flavobacterium kayseriense TaxID=2764714 RepID=A0ABR7JAA9_9FLAO|nr:site-specific integrase [Flavobacterium kayseriense]MBC5842464.1 site-specific integrase [Flavobacterium kayseriense]MBC5848994.1 site-specific integrase [Flavobacterium kayseriense]